MNLLQKIITVLPEGHKDAIKTVLEALKKSSNVQTDREIAFEAQRLVALIKSSGKVLDPNLAEPLTKIDSDSHNANMEEAYVDLKALYSEAAHLSNVQSQLNTSIDSEFNKSKAAILKLINDARVFALRNRKPEFDDIKLTNFNIDRNESLVRPVALVDPESRLLKLPEIVKGRGHLARRGPKVTEATVEIIAPGSQGHLGKKFKPSVAIDGKPSTFWADVVFSDTNIQQIYTFSNLDGSTEIINGPIAKFNIDFSSSEPVNQVKILPFAPYPLRVLEITYRSSSSSERRIPITDFVAETSLDWMEFNFETIYASDIQIVFTQESYSEFSVKVPKHVLYATDFLVKLLEEKRGNLSNIPDINKALVGGSYEIYNDAINDLADILGQKELSKSPSTEVDLTGKLILSMCEALVNFAPDNKSILEEVTTYTEHLPEGDLEEVQTIKKLEYIVGAREIQTNYVVYSPVGNYESGKFEPKSTISNVRLEVDERQQKADDGKIATSTEWEIELSEDRIVPIYPSNNIVDGFLPVISEKLSVDFQSHIGVTRFPSQMMYGKVYANGDILRENVEYSLVWDGTLEGKLQVVFNEGYFDSRKIYTIDYFAAPSSREIDVLNKFKSKRIPKPEVFEGTDANNKVETKYFPFINYGIVNSDDFSLVDSLNTYRYTPPTGVYGTGLVEVHPNWITHDSSLVPISGKTNVFALTGVTGQADASWIDLGPSYFVEPYKYYLELDGVPNGIYEVDSKVSNSEIKLGSVPHISTGLIGNEINISYLKGNLLDYTGGAPGSYSGYLHMPYKIHVVHKDGDEIFGLDNIDYAPLSVKVGGVEAKNITDYVNLEQPAFTVSEASDGEYEFIHDGRNIYFNQSVVGSEVHVDYKWLTKYIKVRCKLRANKAVTPSISPQVNEYRLLLNTTIL